MPYCSAEMWSSPPFLPRCRGLAALGASLGQRTPADGPTVGCMASSGSELFDEFRYRMADNPAVRGELEVAMRVNVGRVNPSDPGNRFIVGGAIEWLVACAAWALNVLTVPGGHSVRGFDLMDLQNAARGLWSVKAQTAKKAGDFRITNGLGGAGKGLVDATVFVSPHLPGLVYIDPRVHAEVAAKMRIGNDATTLPFAAIRKHAKDHPECVIPLAAPMNEGLGTENPFLAYTETIVTAQQFPRLSKMFADAKPPTSSTAGEIMDLVALKDRGAISDEQFNAAVAKITRTT